MHNPHVIFFKVLDSQVKINVIIKQIESAFLKEKKLLITVPNSEAAKYIDHLLWKVPEESFFPHNIIHTTSKEWIGISEINSQNLNQADCLLNLCPISSPIPHQFKEIIELYDETNPERALQSNKKIQTYKALGLNTTIS